MLHTRRHRPDFSQALMAAFKPSAANQVLCITTLQLECQPLHTNRLQAAASQLLMMFGWSPAMRVVDNKPGKQASSLRCTVFRKLMPHFQVLSQDPVPSIPGCCTHVFLRCYVRTPPTPSFHCPPFSQALTQAWVSRWVSRNSGCRLRAFNSEPQTKNSVVRA